jgi:predicted PurR-regulated permease PerM
MAGLVVSGLLLLFHWFVGTVMLGLFFYYAARPLVSRFNYVATRGLAAAVALLVVVLPFVVTTFAVVLLGLAQLATVQPEDAAQVVRYLFPGFDIGALPTDPVALVDSIRNRVGDGSIQGGVDFFFGAVGFFTGALFHTLLALALGFFLLRDDVRIAEWFHAEVAKEGTAVDSYLKAVDRDLARVYFANLAIVFVTVIFSAVVYHLLNRVAPPGIAIPQPLFVAVVTGVATLVPLVGRGLVYVVVGGYLSVTAARVDTSLLWFPATYLVVMFLPFDQVIELGLRPRLASRDVHTGAMLFAYVLGVALFGWYGVFYGPFLLVIALEFIRMVLPRLLRGERPLVVADSDPDSEPESESDPDPASTDESVDDDVDVDDPAAAATKG